MTENKGTPPETSPAKENTNPLEIDKELEGKINTLKLLSSLDTLLKHGLYAGNLSEIVSSCKPFVEKLHSSLLTEVKKHPQAKLIGYLDGRGK